MIHLHFNKKFINKLKKKLPPKILDLNIEFPDIEYHGGVRFDYGKLKAVYIICVDEKILKFEYKNEDFVFTHIYIDGKDKRYEYRYDADMNLVSKYISATPDLSDVEPVTGKIILATKLEEDNKTVNANYISFVDPHTKELELKDFTGYFEILEKYKIVVNNDKLNNKCRYFIKEDIRDVIYLILDIYE